MKTLCVVPCGAKKIWDKQPGFGPMPARSVYVGPFAKKCQEYARKFYPADWVILSAKYGFLRPDEIVPGPYNTSFNHPETHPIRVQELRRLAAEKGLQAYDQVVVLGGKNYVTMVRQAFAGKPVLAPLEGCTGIGYMMGALNEAIKRRRALS